MNFDWRDGLVYGLPPRNDGDDDVWVPPPTLQNMAEVQQPQQKRKRAADNKLRGSGVHKAGEWVVCNHCGTSAPQVLVSGEVPRAAFCGYPCLVGYIAAHATSEAQRTTTALAVAKEFQQPPELVMAFDIKDLVNFGGKLRAEQVIPNYDFWMEHAKTHGVAAVDAGTRKRATKQAKSGTIALEPGVMLVDLKGKIKRQEYLDGTDDAKKHSSATAAALQRKFAKFAADNPTYTAATLLGKGYTLTGFWKADSAPEHFNNTAAQITGSQVCGPCLVIVSQKIVVKV